jgi:hypothetical protein
MKWLLSVLAFAAVQVVSVGRNGTSKKPVLILLSQSAPSELVKRASYGEAATVGYATLNGG